VSSAFDAEQSRNFANTWRALREKPFVFTLDDDAYALPLARVERVCPIVAVTPLPERATAATGVIGLDGKIVPAFSIRARLGLPARAPRLSDRLIIAQERRRVLALPVDTVRGVEHLADVTITAADAPFCGDGRLPEWCSSALGRSSSTISIVSLR
jgi:chemotaxis signal transduction protein